MVQTYHWPLGVCSYLLPLALSPQWPDMDQSHPELGFTSRKQRCTHGSLSSTHCGHGHRYPSYRPLTGCDHEGTNSSQREAAVDEVSGKAAATSCLQPCGNGAFWDIIINVDVITALHECIVLKSFLSWRYCRAYGRVVEHLLYGKSYFLPVTIFHIKMQYKTFNHKL